MSDASLDATAAQYRRLDVLRNFSRSFLILFVFVSVGLVAMGFFYPALIEVFGVAIYLVAMTAFPLVWLMILLSFIRFGSISSRLSILVILAVMAPAFGITAGGFLLLSTKSAPVIITLSAASSVGILIILEIIVSSLAVFFASHSQRKALSEAISTASLLGAPPAVSFITGKNLTTKFLFALAACIGAAAMALLVWALQQLSFFPQLSFASCSGTLSECLLNSAIRPMLELIALATVGAVALFIVGAWVRSLARSGVRKSAAVALRDDPRPPIVFLRSFKDDQVELREPRWTILGFFFGLSSGRSPLDHLLVEEFTQFGPVVAIGRPGEKVPPFGAWRAYVDNMDGEQWKMEVASLVNSARAVVMVIDDTAGVLWEIKHLVSQGHLSKTVLFAPPRCRDPKINVQMWMAVTNAIGLERNGLADTWRSPVLALLSPADGKTVIARSRRFGRSEYLIALRLFFRS